MSIKQEYEDYAARDVSGRNVVALMLSGIF